MNIGIITLSASNNCGSLLQSYALKKVLEKYGNTEIINFSSPSSHAYYDIFSKRMSIWENTKRLRYLNKLLNEKAGYQEFRSEYLQINGKEYYTHELIDIADRYDIVVTGSDQVWNVQMADFDEAFFLAWANSKKVAYAPSLGGRHLNLSDKFEQIKEWLEDINYLSVREELGKECLEEVTDRKVIKVLDPTLLLEEEDWMSIVNVPIIEGDYIFYYSWAYCEESTSKIVSDEAHRLDIPVIVIDARKWQNKNLEKWGFSLCKESGPKAFLNLMYYAKKCYVESFHGMIFAYIFRKNFWLLDIHKEFAELDPRLKELINLLNVKERILTKYNVEQINQNEDIEYTENATLKMLKQVSCEFLNKALGEK